MLPLQSGWQQRLQELPRERFRAAEVPGLPDETSTAAWEYSISTHPDTRLAERISTIGKAWADSSGDETRRIFTDPVALKAAYRLFANPRVSMDDILEPHRHATVLRCAQQPVVLAVQDTTSLNFDTRKKTTQGLTSIGGTAKGIQAHASVAFTPDGGHLLGVLDIDGQFRSRCQEAAGDEEGEETQGALETPDQEATGKQNKVDPLDRGTGTGRGVIGSLCGKEVEGGGSGAGGRGRCPDSEYRSVASDPSGHGV